MSDATPNQIELVAIDGPVGVGKSSVATGLAARLGWQHLDTGAMYRAVALLALQSRTDPTDEAACMGLARGMQFEFKTAEGGQRAIVNGEDASEAIRSHEVTEAVSSIADLVAVREELGRRQRAMGLASRSVAEGRDMGTVVFPEARWKIFLEAAPLERARRRGAQFEAEGSAMDNEALLASIAERDRRDRSRSVGALRVADDAIMLDTTGLTLDRVVGIMESIIRAGV